MTPGLQHALSVLSPAVRQKLKQACSGEWERVTVDERGSFTVHNQIPKVKIVPYVTVLKPVRPRVRKAQPRPAKQTPVVPVESAPVEESTPIERVSVEHPPFTSESVTVPGSGKADFDWDSISDLEGACHALCVRFRSGLPTAIGYSYLPDVLAMEGMNVDSVDASLRQPEYVEVAGESYDKKFPVLRFRRGDAMTVLGLREPTEPKVIAAYWGSKLAHDTYRVNHTGGGGAKASTGLPGTVKAMLKQLRATGCLIEEADEKAVPVSYHGQDLGKVTVGLAPKAVVQSDYQRIVRRMHAVDRSLHRI